MALIDPLRDLQACGEQGDVASLPNANIAVFPQIAHGNADARLGELQLVGNVDRADNPIPMRENQDRL